MTLQHWKLQPSNTFMKFVLLRPKKEMNSYPTLQDKQNTVEQFLNIQAQDAMCGLDTQEPSDDPFTTLDEVTPHNQTVDQVPHTYQASKHEYSTPLSEISTTFTCHVAPPLQAKHEFLVNRRVYHDLACLDVILLSSFDSTPHPPDNMDYSIDPIERSQYDAHLMNLLIALIDPSKHLLIFGFLMKIHLKPNNLTLWTSHDQVSVHTIFPDTMEVHIDVSQLTTCHYGEKFLHTRCYPMTGDYPLVDPLENNNINDSIQIEISKQVMDVLRTCSVSNWASEPYHQNHKLIEQKCRTIK